MKSNVPTWTERCENHLDHQSGMVTNAMIQMRMQEEIDDLRVENERLREALKYYAENHYPNVNEGPWGANSSDFGDVARAALGEEKK